MNTDTPTPRTETDLFEATKVSLEYGNQRLFKKSQSTRIVGEVAFSDGYEYALKHSSKIKQLERELTAAREELADWHNAAEQVKAEYPDEVHCSCVAILRKQLKHVTEQRDEYKAALQSADNHNHEIATKLEIVTEQRDRLAEALEQCREDSVELLGERDWWQNEIRLDYQKRYQETRDNVTRADEALQSLNPDHAVEPNDMIADVKGGNDE